MDHRYLALYTTYVLSYIDKKVPTEKKLLFRTSSLKSEGVLFQTLPISKTAGGPQPYHGVPRRVMGHPKRCLECHHVPQV
jgi:hypothetical protein